MFIKNINLQLCDHIMMTLKPQTYAKHMKDKHKCKLCCGLLVLRSQRVRSDDAASSFTPPYTTTAIFPATVLVHDELRYDQKEADMYERATLQNGMILSDLYPDLPQPDNKAIITDTFISRLTGILFAILNTLGMQQQNLRPEAVDVLEGLAGLTGLTGDKRTPGVSISSSKPNKFRGSFSFCASARVFVSGNGVDCAVTR